MCFHFLPPGLLVFLAQSTAIDQSLKSHNATLPYPTMHHPKKKCTHVCSEWCIVGYGTGVLWDLQIWSILSCLLLPIHVLCDDLATEVLDGGKGEVHVLELCGAGGHCHAQEVDALGRGGHQVDSAIFVEATKQDLVDGIVIALQGYMECGGRYGGYRDTYSQD